MHPTARTSDDDPETSTLSAVRRASVILLGRRGGVVSLETEMAMAREVEHLVSLVVAYGCVPPGSIRTDRRAENAKLTAPGPPTPEFWRY